MKLITDEIRKALPTLYKTENSDPRKIKVILKLLNPTGSQTWYITELSEDGDTAFGFANLGDDEMAELGYVSIKELESIELPFGLKIERDLYWDKETKLSEVMSFKKR